LLKVRPTMAIKMTESKKAAAQQKNRLYQRTPN
jgi:hypothetical protein